MCFAVEVNLLGCLEHLKYTLLGKGRRKDYREVNEWSHTLTYSVFECLDDSLVLILNKIPLVYNHNKRLVVALYKLEYVHILSLYSSCGINHKDTYIRILDGADRAHNRIELQIFRHLVLASDTSSIYKIEVETELVEACIDRIACCTCYLCHDIAVFANKGIDNRTLASIRSTYHGETWNTVLNFVLNVSLKL